MLIYTPDGSVVEPVNKEYGVDSITVRRVTDGSLITCKLSDLAGDPNAVKMAREIRPVRRPR
jgi:hypothetical protein